MASRIDTQGAPLEFFCEGEVVGCFTGPTAPTKPGDYAYEPYRGSGHYELARRLALGDAVECSYVLGVERVTFLARGAVSYGVLSLDEFVRNAELANQRSPRGPWEDLQGVLSGTLCPAIEPRAAKMLNIMLLAPCDVLLRRDSFELWYLSSGRKHRYMTELMAPVVFDLMVSLSIRELHQPVVGVPGGHAFGSVVQNAPSFAVWLVPEESCVQLFVRECPEATTRGRAEPVPPSGPWSMPIPATRKATRWVPAANPCPHCGNHPQQVRMLSDEQSLVCPACGRASRTTARQGDR